MALDTGKKTAVQLKAMMEPTRLIVGIGASAGGLEAFRIFFAKMPARTGMVFVLVQHLDPTFESSLVAIVGGYTAMTVNLARNGTVIQPDQVYIIPPDAILTIKEGILQVTSPAAPAARRVSINTFLTSLAQDQGENAVGIILSGFGSDGALGIAAIKEQGGLTLSQADFDHHAKSGMPQSAAAAGFVDHVLAVEDMPAALLNYQHHRTIFDAAKGPDGIRQDLPDHLTTICAVLNARLGRDFSQYKTGTLMRRIQRRMQVLRIEDVPAYIARLRAAPNEAELLFRELLISVTRFFRDREAFEALEAAIIPTLLTDPRDTAPIRVWVAGCATGEEAYSIAILLKEGIDRSGCQCRVQIFATDLDDLAIETARAGLYPGTIAQDVSTERLERNFVREEGGYRIVKNIREMCLFSMHDLVKDPPFSRLDLVSCRNLLIYFDPLLQNRVITTFHYALRPGRHLFLGSSESITGQSRLFSPVDKRHRLYARQDTVARLPALSPSRPPGNGHSAKRTVLADTDGIDRKAARAIARYMPAFLVVDRHHDILRFSGQTTKYIAPATGIASLNLFNLLHADLRMAVRAALKQADATKERVLHNGVLIKTVEQYETVNLIVEPIPGAGEGDIFVVAFQEGGPAVLTPPPGPHDEKDDSIVQALNRELLGTRERLRTVTEELESASEELQSSNEEYLSVNEELQSANEELETSKEELQSLNEELQTINVELNHRNDSLVRANSDLANLFDSTAIATLFLDNDLRIRRFTPRLLEIFKLREGDEGRPIGDIVTRLTRDGMGRDVEQVLRTLTPIEREVTVAGTGMIYLMQIRAYRDINNVIDGAVISFVDISERKKYEQARSRLAAIVESSQDAIISHDLDGIVTSWNGGAEQLLGYPASEAIGRSMSVLLAEALPGEWALELARLKEGQRIPQFDSIRIARGGQSIEVSVTISPVREEDGRIAGGSTVMRDVSQRKDTERRAALLLGELDHRVKNILAIVSGIISQTLRANLTPKDFAAEIEGRVQAIATAHSMLTQTGQGDMSLRAICVTELAPYGHGTSHIGITGGDVALTPKAGLALAMAIHELTTNAAKYGALSTEAGRLTVTWEVTGALGGQTLTFHWTETGGPAVTPPTRRGFGTTLIERALAHGLDATVNREFLAAGMRCAIAIPLTEDIGRMSSANETVEPRDAPR